MLSMNLYLLIDVREKYTSKYRITYYLGMDYKSYLVKIGPSVNTGRPEAV
jgi:hypothetical protein